MNQVGYVLYPSNSSGCYGVGDLYSASEKRLIAVRRIPGWFEESKLPYWPCHHVVCDGSTASDHDTFRLTCTSCLGQELPCSRCKSRNAMQGASERQNSASCSPAGIPLDQSSRRRCDAPHLTCPALAPTWVAIPASCGGSHWPPTYSSLRVIAGLLGGCMLLPLSRL